MMVAAWVGMGAGVCTAPMAAVRLLWAVACTCMAERMKAWPRRTP